MTEQIKDCCIENAWKPILNHLINANRKKLKAEGKSGFEIGRDLGLINELYSRPGHYFKNLPSDELIQELEGGIWA